MPLSRLSPPALIALLALALFPACDGSTAPSDPGDAGSIRCTLIGCADAVSANFVDFNERFGSHLPASVSLCFDERPCQQTSVQLDGDTVSCPSSAADAADFSCFFKDGRLSVLMSLGGDGMVSGGVHSLHVQLLGKDGEALLDQVVIPTFDAYRPNGPQCEPVCYSSSSAL